MATAAVGAESPLALDPAGSVVLFSAGRTCGRGGGCRGAVFVARESPREKTYSHRQAQDSE